MIKPHIRLAITSDCNFSCKYCKDGGEGVLCDTQLSLSELKTVARIAKSENFSHAKITGGEPLLREKNYGDVIPLINFMKYELEYEDVQLVTNGYFLEEMSQKLASSGLDSITVSLDTFNSSDFKNITGVDCFNKVICGIKKMIDLNFPVTINCVYFKGNDKAIFDIINLAVDLKANIKLLDCVDFNNEDNYRDFEKVYTYLNEMCNGKYHYITPPGGLGTPMRVYHIQNTNIIIKDATVGTNYNYETCKNCKNYPCQDALISLRVTANGKLKRCLIRDDNLVDISNDLRNNNYKQIHMKIREAYRILSEAKFEKKRWSNQ